MTDTEALRRSLDLWRGQRWSDSDEEWLQATEDLENAARRWLALAEGDEAVVEKVAEAILKNQWGELRNDAVIHKREIKAYRSDARAVLAAITEEGE